MDAAGARPDQDRFRQLVEDVLDWAWEIDRNGVYTYASPQVRRLLGFSPEEIIGRSPFDLMPKSEAQRTRKIV